MYELDIEEVGRNIFNNSVVFHNLVKHANTYLNKCHYEKAAIYAQLAADFAWRNHPGLFVSPQLENVLLTIGRKLTDSVDTLKRGHIKKQTPEKILHVLTQGHTVGGHTRFAYNWIQEDASRRHSIALTRQGRHSLPQEMKEAVSSRQGSINFLDQRPGGLLSRAKLLRRIAQSADQIILHTHPYDVVPMIAFAYGNNAPVIFMNHADHVFWIGVGVSQVIAHIRESGLRTSIERRGIEPENGSILPIPLRPKPRIFSRSEAKERLGFNESDIILLTVASGYKYQTKSRINFVETLLPVLHKYKESILLAVGPTDSGQWDTDRHQIQGRVKALGFQEDTSLFFQAADIYLDSFPFSSLTSLLEAASYGVPVIGYHGYPAAAAVLQGDDFALTGKMITLSDLNEYQNAVSHLIEDEKFRLNLGKNIKKRVLAIHTSPGWTQFLEQLYLQAAITPIIKLRQPEETHLSDLDRALSWMNMNTGVSQGLDATVKEHSRLLPFRSRVKVWASMCREKRRLLPYFLLSESVGTQFERKIWG